MSRKFVSLTIFFSFLILFLSSFVLYVIPGGQSGAAGWTFLALGRGQWVDLHITGGLLFLAFGLGHVFFNWRGLWVGLKRLSATGLKSAWPIVAALALNAFIVAGTLNHIQPIEAVLNIYKEAKQEFRTGYVGNPPRQISLESFGDYNQISRRAASEGRAAVTSVPGKLR